MMIIEVMMMMTKVMDKVICWKLVSSDLHLGFGNFECRSQLFSLFSPTLFLHIIRGEESENIMVWGEVCQMGEYTRTQFKDPPKSAMAALVFVSFSFAIEGRGG